MRLNKTGLVAILVFWTACVFVGYSLRAPGWTTVAAFVFLALAAALGVLQVNNT